MAFTRCRWSLSSPILFSICVFFVYRALIRVVVSLGYATVAELRALREQ